MAAASLTAASIAGGHRLSLPYIPQLNLKPPPLLPFHSLSSSFSGTRICFAAVSAAVSGRFHVSGRFAGKNSDDDQAPDFSSLRSDKVRLIDEQQNMVGIVSKSEAIRRAEDSELDLVVVSPDAEPPVVRIMNYDKYRYEQQKKKREQQKKSAASRMDLKELKMGYNIDVHDYTVRLKAAQKFLKDGDKVKVIVNLKGRGNVFLEKAIQLIRKFQNDLGELATEENNNFARRKREEITERFIYMIIVPNKNLVQKTQEAPKKKSSTAPNEVSASVVPEKSAV
ncbi:translation initiation factor IF3-4, chloroplastic [Silene latifolia]|uniref:translation initiation factor IF3-4, chloroplastic n=1 Tax=Silene latifolia TaxID=37657 RepID=UPI003D77C631